MACDPEHAGDGGGADGEGEEESSSGAERARIGTVTSVFAKRRSSHAPALGRTLLQLSKFLKYAGLSAPGLMWSRNVASVCKRRTRGMFYDMRIHGLCLDSDFVACLHAPSRSLASVAEAPTASSSTSDAVSAPNVVLNAAVILNRSPILTRTPTLFERAYFAYQSRVRRALYNPFPTDFYFKTGSLLERKFAKEERLREAEAFGGQWSIKRRKQAASELDEDGVLIASPDQAETMGEEAVEPTAPRVHESDKTGDVKSLDRKGERNLYLLVRGKDHTGKQVWRFPQGGLEEGELLHKVRALTWFYSAVSNCSYQAASRDLEAECGINMDTWIVGKKPVAVHRPSLPESTKKSLGGEVSTPLIISLPPKTRPHMALLRTAVHFLPQGTHPRGSGPARRQERHRLCVAHKRGDRASSGEGLLGERAGYSI